MRMLAASVLAAAAIAIAGCGGRDTVDDSALHHDIIANANGSEVTFNATLVSDPVETGGHERFTVKSPAGDLVEIDHNTTLAATVPIRAGDAVVIHGQLYIDPGPRIGVHCTHAKTSRGCPNPGWIMFGGNYYE